ncbi:hypothetical protein KIF24_01535 [Micromonospora sp. Llam7]|uniref:hypothetical protein n=1 Tax=Micromonospora tarapacensis TaxID=2835305 RepID=UPI001C82D42A|nr:hypothetical protein [Micromonospora tarapacensis]MBX7264866.1 hypothetical protein [Micromonospora tarapacensis]
MRLTVGPLSPAVYWRRRAVVLGAVLLFLVVLLYSFNGPDGGNDATGDGEADPVVATGTPDPTGSVLTPQTGSPPSGDAGADPSTPADDPDTEPSLSNDPPTVDPATDEGTCVDSELAVTALALPAQVAPGASVDLHLKVRNRSDRTCSRDVGATVQELYIKSGAEVVWSSDTCGTASGSDVQSFTPGFERSYQVGWNGRGSSRCANGLANGPTVPAGTYEVFARVGTRLSQPAKLTLG